MTFKKGDKVILIDCPPGNTAFRNGGVYTVHKVYNMDTPHMSYALLRVENITETLLARRFVPYSELAELIYAK